MRPTASMSKTRGNLTFSESPCRMNSSDRLRPNALTCFAFGIGRYSIWKRFGHAGPVEDDYFHHFRAILCHTDVEKRARRYGSFAGYLSGRATVVSRDISKHLRKDLEGD